MEYVWMYFWVALALLAFNMCIDVLGAAQGKKTLPARGHLLMAAFWPAVVAAVLFSLYQMSKD